MEVDWVGLGGGGRTYVADVGEGEGGQGGDVGGGHGCFWGGGLFVGERTRRYRFGGDFRRIVMVVARSLSWLGDVGVLRRKGGFVVTLWSGVDRWTTFGECLAHAQSAQPARLSGPTLLSRGVKCGAEMSAGFGFGSGVKSPATGNQIAGRASHHQLDLGLQPGPLKKQGKKQRNSPPEATLPRWTLNSDRRLLFLPDETRAPTPLPTPGLPFPSRASTLDVFTIRHRL